MVAGAGRFHIRAGHNVGQLAGVGDHLIVGLGRGELHPTEAQVHKEVPGALKQLRLLVAHGGEDHAGVVEQVVLGILEAGEFPACHGVAADEMPAVFFGQGH